MPIDYSLFKFGKGRHRVLEKADKKDEEAAEEAACRKAVDLRDKRQCFFPGCKARAGEKHHIQRRGAGGKWTTDNILSACTKHHSWFKAQLIEVEGNPDKGPVNVKATRLGVEEEIKIPPRLGVGHESHPTDVSVRRRDSGNQVVAEGPARKVLPARDHSAKGHKKRHTVRATKHRCKD